MLTYICPGCKEEKLPEEFGKRSASKDGLAASCKKCVRARQRAYYAANVEKFRSKGRARRYGMTEFSLNTMKSEQNDKCGICNEPLGSDFHVDHNHETGIVRGLLCQDCNLGLGRFKDNKYRLLSAISYLEREDRF